MHNHVLLFLGILFSMLSIGIGCRSRDHKSETLSISDLISDETQAIRLALVHLGEDLPNIAADDLNKLPGVGPTEVIIDQDYSRSLREGIIGSVGYLRSIIHHEKSVVRRDLYTLKADITPFSITGLGAPLTFPFTLQAGATIEIGRIYPNSNAAKAAPVFSFADLPYSIEKIKNLPPGTFVNLPIRGSAVFEANGDFLTEAYNYTKTIKKYLNLSSTGTYSDVSQGTLMAQGVFSLQIIRLDRDRVRVRILHGDDIKLSRTNNFGFDVRSNLTFVPASKLQKIRDIKELVENGIKNNPIRQPFNSIKERVEQFKNLAQNELKPLFQQVPGEFENPEVKNVLEASEDAIDQAVIEAEKIENKVTEIDQKIFGKADKVFEKSNNTYKNRLEPVLDKIKEHTDRDLDVKNSLALNAELSRKVRVISDYIFDLKDDVSNDALKRAVFANSAWIGEAPANLRDIKNTLFYDLATAESIATLDQAKTNPRVIRLVRAGREFRDAHLGFNFQALFFKIGMQDYTRENTVSVIDRSGKKDEWYSRIWEYNQTFKLAQFIEATEIYSSGFVTQKKLGDLNNASYWFAWQANFQNRSQSPIQRTLEAGYSFLGPIAVKKSIASIYTGEFQGPVTSRIQATFNGDILKSFFDPKKASDALLWRAFLNMVNAVNGPSYGIPFMDNNITPVGLDKIEGAEKACEQVSIQWGRLYCTIFQDDFLAKLKDLRTRDDSVARLSFFENYFRSGFLFNQLGSRLMVRYMSEVSHLLEMTDKVDIQVDITNQHDLSNHASPHLKGSSSQELRMLEAMDMIGGARK